MCGCLVLMFEDPSTQGVRLYLEFFSFLWLRKKWAHVPRFYKVPGGWWGAWAITIPKFGLITWMCATADWMTWKVTLIINGTATVAAPGGVTVVCCCYLRCSAWDLCCGRLCWTCAVFCVCDQLMAVLTISLGGASRIPL